MYGYVVGGNDMGMNRELWVWYDDGAAVGLGEERASSQADKTE